MKKFTLIASMALLVVFTANSQKYAVVDMDYILKAIPQYESANDQLNQLSNKWQKEIEAMQAEVQTMYKNYQTELVFLTPALKKNREDSIISRERQVNDLKKRYFGPEGEMFKRRESLIKPIQDEIYNAIQELSNSKKYDLIFDKNSTVGIIFAAPKIDISDEILTQMGYSIK